MKTPNLTDTEQILLGMKDILVRTYSVSGLGIFGSVVRAEAGPHSDIDLLVNFSKPVSLFEFVDLEEFLSEKMGHKIDLVMKTNLKRRLGERILAEVRYLWND